MNTPIDNSAITPERLTSIQQTAATITGSLGVTERAVTKNGIYKTSENVFIGRDNPMVFSDEIEVGEVTDQKSSGRCWLFGALNVVRHSIEKDLKIDSLELSESYSFFWDKFERANAFYEHVIETAATPLDNRRVAFLIGYPQADGGWWEYATSLFMKYGVVPKTAMAEAEATSNSYELNVILNRKLRKDGLALRALAEKHSPAELRERKLTMLAEVYALLCTAIGTPPQSFTFSYRDKDKKYHRYDDLSPTSFAKRFVKTDFTAYATLVNDPSRPFGQTYTRDAEWNVVGGMQFLYLNCEIDQLKALTLAQIKAGEGVFFGCDVRADVNKDGYMSPDIYDFNGTFNLDVTMTKAERIMSHDTAINHTMTIVGADVKDGTPTQWKVENSWGDDVGKKGYYTMSDSWFDQNGFMVVIKKELLSEKLLKDLGKEPVVLQIWDTPDSRII